MECLVTRAKLAILLLVALAFAAPALARPDQAETVSIRIMPPGGICGGVCPWFEASLDGQGLVTVRDLAFGDADSLTHSFQYVAPTRGAAGFRTVLLPLRPARRVPGAAN